jgi:cholesterol transport system auxiliary component
MTITTPAALRRLRAAALATMTLAAVMLAGCGGFSSDAPADRIYILNVAPPAATPAAVVQGVLLVPRPAVQPGLDTDRIALTRPGNQLDYFAASRWGVPLPRVLGAFAVQSLGGSFATVASADRGAGPGDYELLLTARHFEAEYPDGGGPPVARVAFECLLVGAAPRRVLGGCDADVREPAAENRMAAIVSAFERASQRALDEVRAEAVAAATAAR